MENNKTLSDKFIDLIKDNVDPKKYFHKKKYAAYFEEYCKTHEQFFLELSDATAELSDEEKDTLFNELAIALTGFAKKETENLGRMKRENKKSELNLYMVTSVFPCVLKLAGDDGEALCNALVKGWKEEFYGLEIGFTTYEKLCESFRGFWGFLTGR